MKSKIMKKAVSLLLMAVTILGTVIGGATPAFAAETLSAHNFSFPRENDANWDSSSWGRPAQNLMSGWYADSVNQFWVHTVGDVEDTVTYCIEPGVNRPAGSSFTKRDESFWDNYPSSLNVTIQPDTIKLLLGRIMQYGYQGKLSTSWVSQNEADANKIAHVIATQMLVWETVVGERDADFNHVSTGGKDAIMTAVKSNHPLRAKIMSYYNSIVASVQSHTIIPSFMAKSSGKANTVDLQWDGSHYSAVLTDSNGVVGNFTFTSDNSKVKFSTSGSKLTVYSDEPLSSPVSISATRSNTRMGVITWSDGSSGPGTGYQDVVTYGEKVSDPVKAFLNVKTSVGDLKIVKTAEDGKVEGITFIISGNGVDQTVKTGKDGTITVKGLTVGTYTVTEKMPGYYEDQKAQTVTVKLNETATVKFDNNLKRGNLEIVKTSEDGLVEGVKFRLYGTADNGDKVDLTASTNAKGVATFQNVLIGSYTVEEVDTAERYVIPDKQTTKIEWNKVMKLRFENDLKRGDLEVVKISEDGMVEGVEFHLYGTAMNGDAVDVYAKTNKKGVATFKNILIGSGYTLEEVNTKAWYIVPDNQTTPIEWNKVMHLDVENTLKRGSLTVTKNSEDGLNDGVKFHLYGTSDSGIAVDEYAVTDQNGVAEFKNILIGSGYTLEEVDTAIRYVVPDNQEGAVEWNKVTQKSFTNILKKFRVTLTKVDSETGEAQADATLAGAVYGLYKGDELIASYTTDENGQFTTDYYPCGDEWSVIELTPSEGYLLDETTYHVGAEAKLYTIELNDTEIGSKEDIIKGKITIIKHCDDGETGVDTPEVGAKFEVYLKSAGSFEDAVDSERDLLICDENGYAESKDLPYGTYTVHQVSGWDGRELMPDFDVYIAEDGQIYRFLINNAVFESYIKVVKVDSETGKTIPYAGAGFQIYDPEGKKVSMTYTYPELTEIDTFYTTSDGTLITPEKLPYGKGYSLVEAQAPYGYVLDGTPISFDVTEDKSTKEQDITLIIVEKNNAPQKGIISIEKTGEVFASVTQSGDMYTPVYEVRGLAGAVYEIKAAEDIITPDGTVRAEAGTVVDTITTDETGLAKSKELYLGKYTVTEIEAPYGMVLNTEAKAAELVYAGQDVALTETSVSFCNERQKAVISLNKVMKKDELFGIGENGEITSVRFGLYAAKAMTAADGSEIPENGLIDAANCNENGIVSFTCDIPVDSELYVKEIATDKHYIVSEDTFPVVFEYAGQETATVEIKVNDGKEIVNELIYGGVRGLKVDEDGNTVSGATFGLFAAAETEFDADHAIMTTTTNEEGIFTFEKLVYGDYVVREISAAEGFVLNETVYPVSIHENNELIEIGFENMHITGTVELTKVDEDYPENKLTGAEFEIWLDLDGDKQFDAEKDVLLGLMTEVETGIYQMEGLRYGGYFAYEKTAPEGFIKDDGYYYFEIREDGKTVTVENEAGVGFINKMRTGSIRIEKTSEDGVLKGFTFKVEGKDICGNVFSKEYVTDENGQILIEGLRIGEYTVSEVSNDASARYVLPENVTLNVLEDKTTVAKFYNKIQPDIPKTGDNTHMGLWAAIAAASLLGIGATAFITFRKKKKEGVNHDR